jgi:hypothetical protein
MIEEKVYEIDLNKIFSYCKKKLKFSFKKKNKIKYESILNNSPNRTTIERSNRILNVLSFEEELKLEKTRLEKIKNDKRNAEILNKKVMSKYEPKYEELNNFSVGLIREDDVDYANDLLE